MASSVKPINKSLKDYGRGITGGLLFSLPMLYTMELWWTGFIASSLQLIIYFIVGMFLLMVYNHYVGIHGEHTLLQGFEESIEEMGLAFVLTVFVLWIMGRLTPEMSINEISGKIIVEAVTVAIGISVGKSQLSGESSEDKDKSKDEQKKNDKNPPLLRSVNIALCGAILIASNVAPTDEIVLIALESEIYKLLIIALIAVGIGGSVLYYINFKGAEKVVREPSNFKEVVIGTIIMYAVALASSAFMLWFFGRFENLSLYGIVAETVVLAFPAALGASAGRLLIQT